jgi:putative peptidoglycan lipid II flippase
MALGTGVSRVTGVARVAMIAFALGSLHLADAYNLANSVPNMLYDVVLGGVLSATFIPVFVDRLANRSENEAWRAISAVVTVAGVVVVVASVVFFFVAPLLIDAFTAFDQTHRHGASQNLAQEKAVATTLLRWFVPQVALYGFLALATSLLNTARRFVAPMWVPIANNIVCIGVLAWFALLVHRHPSLAGIEMHHSEIVLLGLGTTAGVAVQAFLLACTLRGSGLGKLRWRFEPGHEAVRRVLTLGSWTFGFVVANQIALFVVLALAVGAGGGDPVSSYTYAYAFLQMPYAVVAISIMSAVTPELSERWSRRDLSGFRTRLAGGLRAVLALMIPAAVGMLLLARPAVALVIGHGATTAQQTGTTGAALALFAIGLPGFCVFLYVVRVLQTMQRTHIAFWLYLLENGINVIAAVLLVHSLGVRGLALSLSIAYSLGAIAGLVVLRRWLGPLGDRRLWSPLRRVCVASVAMGVAVLVVSNISSGETVPVLFARVLGSIAVGLGVYVVVASILGRRGRRGGAAPPPSLGTHLRRPSPPGRYRR